MVNPEQTASATPSSSAAPQAQAQPVQQNITVTNRQLNITPFVIDRDPTNAANRWGKWKKDIERQFRFFGIQDPGLKKDGLILYGGHDIAGLEDSLPDVESTDPPADEYTKFIRKLDKHFLPKKNQDYAKFQLGNLQQEEDESFANYLVRVREIAKKCEYHDENDVIRDHFIKTMRKEEFELKPFDKVGVFKKSWMKPLLTKRPTSKRPKWKRRFPTNKKMLNASKKCQLQNHVVDVGVNTRKNARRSAQLAPHVKNDIITQTSAKLTLKKRKAFVHSKTKLAIQKIPEQDAISEDKEIIEDQTIVMEKSTKCQVRFQRHFER